MHYGVECERWQAYRLGRAVWDDDVLLFDLSATRWSDGGATVRARIDGVQHNRLLSAEDVMVALAGRPEEVRCTLAPSLWERLVSDGGPEL